MLTPSLPHVHFFHFSDTCSLGFPLEGRPSTGFEMLCRHRDHQIKFWFQNREKGRGCHVTGRWSQWEGAPEREPAERAARPLGPRPRRRGSSAHFRARGRVTRVPPSWLGVTRPVTLPRVASQSATSNGYPGDTQPLLG
jgi:hypothetical protein